MKNRNFCIIVASLLLETLMLTFVFSSVCILIKIPVGYYSLLIGVFASFLLCKVVSGIKWDTLFLSGLTAISLIAVTMYLSYYLYDYSWDGQWYHSHIIWELSKGWNPITEGINEGGLFDDELWANYYQKNYELLASIFVCITNNLNTGKAVNMLLFGGSLVFVYLSVNKSIPNYFVIQDF